MKIDQLVEHYTPVIYDFIKDLPVVVKSQKDFPACYSESGLELWSAPVQDEAGFASESGRQCEILTFEVRYYEVDIIYASDCPTPMMLNHYPWEIEEGQRYPKSYYEIYYLFSYESFQRNIDLHPLKRVTWWNEVYQPGVDRQDSVYISNFLDGALRYFQALNAQHNYISPVLGVMQHD